MHPIRTILASDSPRRRDLMREAGWDFEILTAEVEELPPGALPFLDLVQANADRKCAPVAAAHPEALVIGADTLVAIDGEPLGKPVDLEDAVRMLQRLTGRTHVVATGVALRLHAREVAVTFVEQTRVTFLDLGDAQIRHYLTLIDPLDKAGAYAAQEHGDKIIARTEGSWTNVVGLPMERLERETAGLRTRSTGTGTDLIHP